MDRRSSTNYLRFFLATKMVVPLESAQSAILALNRKRQFPLFDYGQYFLWELNMITKNISTSFHELWRWIDIFLDLIPLTGRKRN